VEESEKRGVGELSIRATLQTENAGEVEVDQSRRSRRDVTHIAIASLVCVCVCV
jgi:hypothetical protein